MRTLWLCALLLPGCLVWSQTSMTTNPSQLSGSTYQIYPTDHSTTGGIGQVIGERMQGVYGPGTVPSDVVLPPAAPTTMAAPPEWRYIPGQGWYYTGTGEVYAPQQAYAPIPYQPQTAYDPWFGWYYTTGQGAYAPPAPPAYYPYPAPPAYYPPQQPYYAPPAYYPQPQGYYPPAPGYYPNAGYGPR